MKNITLLYKYLYLVFGILIGAWHLYFGTFSIFVFRENEPILSWLTIMSGPILTLPAVLIGITKPRISSWCLFCGSTLSLFFMGVSEGFHGGYLLRFAVYVNLPMYILGIINLMLKKQYSQ